jgi:RNA polymerase sigma-70 factor (ECF subfamily)
MDWDHDQYARVFNEFYPGLCRFLECLLAFDGQAQDVAQEAFLRLYRRGPSGIPPDEIRFWIYRVARNLAVNELEKRRTRSRLLGVFGDLDRPAPPNPEAILELAERERRVLPMLATLPEHQRAALLLREQEEMSYREIAHVLGVSENKIKVDIFRARKALREAWMALSSGTRKICND